jgi:hypothetical protein
VSSGAQCGLGSVVHSKLGVEAFDVSLHGVHREKQLVSDLSIGEAQRNQRQHFLFAL